MHVDDTVAELRYDCQSSSVGLDMHFLIENYHRSRMTSTTSDTLPLPAGQALALWSLPPVGPHVCADDAAAGADHARAEGTPA
jgi:hypothetical protein